METLEALEQAAAKAKRAIKDKRAQRKRLIAEMEALQSAGIVFAKPHYRGGKYLYQIEPVRDGGRKRNYIGNDPDKVENALAQMDRAVKWQTLATELESFDRGMVDSLTILDSVVEELAHQ